MGITRRISKDDDHLLACVALDKYRPSRRMGDLLADARTIQDSPYMIKYAPGKDSALMFDPYIEKLNEGKRLARDGKPDRAIGYFLLVAELSKIAHLGYYYMGLQFLTLGMFEDALKYFDKALELMPNHAQALDRRCIVLCLLKRNKEACECLEKASREPGDHHYIQQFIELKEAGYEDLILPDFKSDPNAKIMPDTSACLEFLGVGSQFHMPQLLRFLEKHLGRLIVTRTVISEVHSVLEKQGRRNDPAIQERLGMLNTAVVDAKADEKTIAKLGRLLLDIIAKCGSICQALWLAKSREGERITQKDGQIILPDKDKLMEKLYERSSNDRRIVAETVAYSTNRSCMVYLLATDFDITTIAVHIYEISDGTVLPVRPEQIIWDLYRT